MTKSSPRIVAIVQARLGSTRLPLKSLLCLRGYPLVDWVARRLQRSGELDDIIFAIPDTPLDSILSEHLEREGVVHVKASENDVLDRFCKAASAARADIIVRVCADNPLVSPEAVDMLVQFYKNNRVDYAYNHIPRSNLWPDGLGAEIISRQTLEYLNAHAKNASQREHCLNYIWDNPDQWKIATFNPAEKWLQRPDIKLDIDSSDDFRKMAHLNIHPDMTLEEIMNACNNNHSD